jgi:hypothetical protein
MLHRGHMNGERRVWDRLPAGTAEALSGLSPTDLQTLLLSIARTRAARVRPADLLRRWNQDRFVRPSTHDPRALAGIESRLWRLLPDEVDGVELSPVVPVGASSAVAPVSQNRIVTTVRLTEVLSDATNALAIEAAARRRHQSTTGYVHLAASHRHLRAQHFGPGRSAHFRLFALVSSARDTGSGTTQARLLTLHLRYWQRVLATLPPSATPQLRFTVFDSAVTRERIHDTVLPALATTVPVVEDSSRERGQGYYIDAALRLTAQHGDTVVELGDGGFTTWTAQLMGNAKERCLVSCVSTEQLATLTAG